MNTIFKNLEGETPPTDPAALDFNVTVVERYALSDPGLNTQSPAPARANRVTSTDSALQNKPLLWLRLKEEQIIASVSYPDGLDYIGLIHSISTISDDRDSIPGHMAKFFPKDGRAWLNQLVGAPAGQPIGE